MLNKDSRRIWIFSELFYPEETSTAYILTKISKKLNEKYRIEVVCGYPTYDNLNKKLNLNDASIKINRVRSFKGNKNNNIIRVLKFLYLSFAFLFYLIFKVKKNEKVFVVTNPAPFLVLASALKRVKNYQLIILVHDVFPENTIPANYVDSKRTFIYSFVKKIFDHAYANFDVIVVLGRDMKVHFQNKLAGYSRKPKIIIIENWAAIDEVFPKRRESKDLNNKIVIQFAGNLGATQGLDWLINLIPKIVNPLLVFHFIGSGKMKKYMEEFVIQHNLKNVIFKPAFSRLEQNDILNDCDMALITLSKGMKGLGVPSKTYNILASGKPILYIGDKESEVSLLIEDYNIGFNFDIDRKDEVIEFLNSITHEMKNNEFSKKGNKAREIAVRLYSEDVILDKYMMFL